MGKGGNSHRCDSGPCPFHLQWEVRKAFVYLVKDLLGKIHDAMRVFIQLQVFGFLSSLFRAQQKGIDLCYTPEGMHTYNVTR